MPRLPPSLIQKALRQHPFLPLLLLECRDISSAKNELRWLSEHAIATNTTKNGNVKEASSSAGQSNLKFRPRPGDCAWPTLQKNVFRRARGEPLQYILGTQPFGELEILCQKDVLIPRLDTEAYTTRLAGLLRRILEEPEAQFIPQKKLRILDLCTGSGCIALLLYSQLKSTAAARNVALEIVAIDISEAAIALSEKNLQHNILHKNLPESAATDIIFLQDDIFTWINPLERLEILMNDRELAHLRTSRTTNEACLTRLEEKRHNDAVKTGAAQDLLNIMKPMDAEGFKNEAIFDVVISNPPYISPSQYRPGGTIAQSVRGYEPKIALVPPSPNQFRDSQPQPLSKSEAENRDHKRADLFYPAIYQIGRKVGAQIVVMEVGDSAQGSRVTKFLNEMRLQQINDVERWATGDDGSNGETKARVGRVSMGEDDGQGVLPFGSKDFEEEDNQGVGQEAGMEPRAVVVWRGRWAQWRSRVLDQAFVEEPDWLRSLSEAEGKVSVRLTS